MSLAAVGGVDRLPGGEIFFFCSRKPVSQGTAVVDDFRVCSSSIVSMGIPGRRNDGFVCRLCLPGDFLSSFPLSTLLFVESSVYATGKSGVLLGRK